MTGPFGIQDLISPNGFRIRVGEQRELDLATVSEVLQYFLAIITDGRQFDSLFFKSRFRVLQLDQLPFAVRSPVGRAEKEKNGAIWSFQCIEALLLAKLIARGKRQRLPTYGESNGGKQLERDNVKRIALDGPSDRNAVTQVTDALVLRIEDENLSRGVVIQGKFCPRYIFSALGRLGKSFVRGAIAVYDDARPRSRVCIVVLSGQRKAGNKKTRHHPHQR